METRAHLSNARIAPRKARAVRSLIIGLGVKEALAQLSFTRSKGAAFTYKLLQSAVANAKSNNGLEEENLWVKEFKVNEGFRFKRHRPVSRGMAHPFVKRNSHLTVVLEEFVPTAKKQPKKTDITTLSVEELAGKSGDAGVVVEEKETRASSEAENIKQSAQDEAYQIMKARQQGGEKTKTHRRKSF